MTPKYSTPLISNELGRTGSEAAADRNSYARGQSAPSLSEIDGNPVRELLAKFGSPLFVFSEHALREKAKCLRTAFCSRYPNTDFAWSYKTNYLSAICRVFHQEGWIAEVVSDFEYQKARKLGIAGRDIVFNGPYKPRAILQTAIDEGALIQIDHWDELCLIEELVKDREEPLAVGIRVWLDAGIRPIWSKFGFSVESGEAGRAAAKIAGNPKLVLHTLHTHIGTYILEPKAYGIAVRKLVALREQIRVEHKHLVSCLNLGGGFPSHSLLHGMIGNPEQLIPPIELYAEEITSVLNELPVKQRPRLRFETGRFLVDEAGYLLTSVVAVKGIRHPMVAGPEASTRDYKEQLVLGEDAKASYLIDAGVNLLYTGAWYQINVYPDRPSATSVSPARLYGPLCMAIDVIRYAVDLPPLNIGDPLTLHPVGAYNVTQAMQFITYRPAVILINEQGNSELIRKREVLADIEISECMPDRLKGMTPRP
ncbi:MAG: diaminopimelate decarboxylase [Bacteroidota bacterium]